MKILRVVLYMNVQRNEVVLDVRRQTGVGVRLCLEPNTPVSTGRRAEVDEKRLALIFRLIQCFVSIGDPIHGHKITSLSYVRSRSFVSLMIANPAH